MIDNGYYAWMIVATALVLMMTTPARLASGIERRP